MIGLVRDGAEALPPDAALYIRPMYWAEQGGYLSVRPIRHRRASCCPSTRRRCRRRPASRSRCRRIAGRPSRPCRPTPRPAASIRTTAARSTEARARGFDNALVRDMLGNVAETGTSNVFMVKDGVVDDADPEPLVPERHHAPARHQPPARRRRRGGGGHVPLVRFPRRRRDLLHRQLFQGGADHPHRGSRAAAGAARPKARKLYWDWAHS